MKKRLMVLVILALSVSLAAVAQAAAWPPKSLAFQWQNDPNVYTILAIKQTGSVKTLNRTTKFYDLSGATFDSTDANLQYPIGGYGYVNGAAFIFCLSGTMEFAGSNGFFNLEGTLFPTGGGTTVRGSFNGGWGTTVAVPIVVVPASALNFPLMP